MQNLYRHLMRILGNPWFFRISLAVFVFQAIWLASSAIYPLPFDEYYHYGIAEIYSQQWSPFITSQPPEASIYGDITRYPSYLYHYLLSFPLRFIALFISSLMGQVIALRLISIALFAAGFVLFRRLFLGAKVSPQITHTALFFLMVTPITPFLAAHINYDALVWLLTPIIFILGYQVIRKKQVPIIALSAIVLLSCIGLLVKEPFLVIALIVNAYVWTTLLWRWRKGLLGRLWGSFRALSVGLQLLICVSLVISIGLVTERYVVNQIKYGAYNAPCETVQPVSVCEQNAPWYRNNQNIQNKPAEPLYSNPISFSQHWASKITRGFFAVFSHTPTEVVSEREPFGPIVLKALLPLPIVIASLVMLAGAPAILLARKKLWSHQFYRYLLISVILYTVVVWIFNYVTYLELGAAQAIQARYFIPIMPLVLVLIIQALAWLIRSQHNRLLLFAVIGAVYVYTGGIAGWLIRADPNWYWQKQPIIQVNQQVQQQLKRVIIH